MKVLITGGCGFIGSHVAEYFSKEGHTVTIIDNLSTGTTKNVSVKYNFYNINIEDVSCDEIFRSHKFDIVVHLAAQEDSNYSRLNPYLDSKVNMLGLVNILKLSTQYGAKKFIFASSLAVYGNSTELPLKEDSICKTETPHGVNKNLAEMYLEKWGQMHKLDIVCLRLSNVYGPKQLSSGENNVVATFIEKGFKGSVLNVYGDGEQTRDFIYVSDVCKAIYKISQSYVTGVFNLSSNTQTSINHLIDTLKNKMKLNKVIFKNRREFEIKYSQLDNTLLKRKLDWVPVVSLEEGIKKTIDWKKNKQNKKESCINIVNDSESDMNSFNKLIQKKLKKSTNPYIENIGLFIVVVVLNYFLRDNPTFKSVDINLIYIIIIGIAYGTRQSLIAVTLSCIAFLIDSLGLGRDIMTIMYDNTFMMKVVEYLLPGLAVGYFSEKRDQKIVSDKKDIELLKEKNTFIQDLYNESITIKDVLQNQILNTENGIGKIYDIVSNLNSLNSQDIIVSSINVLEEILKTDEIAIYNLDKTSRYMRLAIKSSKNEFIVPKSIRIKELDIDMDSLLKGNLYLNKNMIKDLPMMIYPLKNNDKVIAFICLYNVEFEKLTLYYQNLLKITANLISISLDKAFAFENITEKNTPKNEMKIYDTEKFLEILEKKRNLKTENRIDYIMFRILKENINSYKMVSSEISNLIREDDLVGLDKLGNIVFLFNNAIKKDAEKILHRLNNNGIKLNEFVEVQNLYA